MGRTALRRGNKTGYVTTNILNCSGEYKGAGNNRMPNGWTDREKSRSIRLRRIVAKRTYINFSSSAEDLKTGHSSSPNKKVGYGGGLLGKGQRKIKDTDANVQVRVWFKRGQGGSVTAEANREAESRIDLLERTATIHKTF